MRADPALPDWLTGLTQEDTRARELQDQQALPPESGARPADPHDDLAWLDEFTNPPAAQGHISSSPPPAFAQSRPPRVTRVSSSPATPTAQPATTSISSPPPTAATPSHHPGRFTFRRLPAWWQAQDERRSRSSGPHPAWLRE